MFFNILTVSTVCVLLTYSGWVPDGFDTTLEPIQRINNQSIIIDDRYSSTTLKSSVIEKNTSITQPECCLVKGVTGDQKSLTGHVNSLPTEQAAFTYVREIRLVNRSLPLKDDGPDDDDYGKNVHDNDVDPCYNMVSYQINLTFPILALRDRPDHDIISGRITGAVLIDLGTKDVDITDRDAPGHRVPLVSIYRITDIPYEGRKHSWMLVMLKATVPVWMVVILVKEKREQLKQLKILEVLRVQKQVLNKNNDESKHSHGKGDIGRRSLKW